MKSILCALSTIIALSFLMTNKAFSQQQVDIRAFEETYKGGFFRVDVGITPGIITYTDVLDGDNAIPIYFDLVGGRRFGRSVALYGLVYGHIQPKETNVFSSFSQSGFSIGSNFYLKNPNTYFAPEVGLALLSFEEMGGNSYSSNTGLKLALKWGRDFLIAGKTFIGTHIYLSYFTASSGTDEYAKGSGFFYGVNLSVKYGK